MEFRWILPVLAIHMLVMLAAPPATPQTPCEEVLCWPLSPDNYWVRPDKYVWYYDHDNADATPLFGYHSGEDWNGIGTQGDEDCDDSDTTTIIRSAYDGEVVPSDSGVGGEIVVVHHELPDSTDIYMTYRHCKLNSIADEGPIGKHAEICRMGNTGTFNCHMHWELTAVNPQSVNPWFGGQSTTCRYPFALPPSPEPPERCPQLIPGIRVANYGSPSLLLDDWGNAVVEVPLTENNWEYFNASHYVPSSIMHIRSGTLNPISITDACVVDLIDIQYRVPSGSQWSAWSCNDESFIVRNIDYRIMLKSSTQYTLFVPVPGHNQRPTRARMEMMQWANMAACNDENDSSCFFRPEAKSGGFLFDGWEINWMEFETRDNGGDIGRAIVLHATDPVNPLLRCIRKVDPATGTPEAIWTQIKPGKVYAIPNVALELVTSTDPDDHICNEIFN